MKELTWKGVQLSEEAVLENEVPDFRFQRQCAGVIERSQGWPWKVSEVEEVFAQGCPWMVSGRSEEVFGDEMGTAFEKGIHRRVEIVQAT